MYSLSVSVPGEAKRLASELFPRLLAFDRVREEHTLLVKRFEPAGSSGSRENKPNRGNEHGLRGGQKLATLRKRVGPILDGTPAFEARITGIDCFEEPTRGPGPVLYFAIESPGLYRVHRRLVEEFGAVPELEGAEYTPHVTLARGGSLGDARELVGSVEPVEWVISELRFWDPRYRETLGRVSLSA